MCIETWCLALYINAVRFCDTTTLFKEPCVQAYIECVLDDNKDYCENNIMEYYEGRTF